MSNRGSVVCLGEGSLTLFLCRMLLVETEGERSFVFVFLTSCWLGLVLNLCVLTYFGLERVPVDADRASVASLIVNEDMICACMTRALN